MADYLKVTQLRSSIGRLKNQGQTLRGLGIRKRGHTVFVKDTPSARGMIGTVGHLVEWSEATAADREASLNTEKKSYYVVEGSDA